MKKRWYSTEQIVAALKQVVLGLPIIDGRSNMPALSPIRFGSGGRSWRRAPFDVTASYPAFRIRVTHIPAGMREVIWRKVPEPVPTVRLDGSVDYETSDGEVRHVPAGSFVLVQDVHGKRYLSRHSSKAQTVIWIALPNGLDLSQT